MVGTLHARSRERTSCTRTSMRLFSAVLVIEMSEISEMSGVAGLRTGGPPCSIVTVTHPSVGVSAADEVAAPSESHACIHRRGGLSWAQEGSGMCLGP